MSKQRLDYIDIAKAYLIFLVIVGHILIVLNPTYSKLLLSAGESWITSFHMPAFFVIHGILFNEEKWKKKSFWNYLKSRSFSLLVPYLFFETIGIICRLILYKQSIKDGLYNLITVRCNIGADWFLIAMFMGCMVFWFVNRYFNHICSLLMIILSFLIPVIMRENQLLIVLSRGVIAFGFIMIGYYGKKMFLDEKIKTPLWIVGSFLIVTVSAIMNLKVAGNDIYLGVINSPLTLYMGGVSGTVFTLGIAKIIKIKESEIIGKHTLSIMGTHQLVIYTLPVLFPIFNNGNLLLGLLMFLAIVLFEIPVVYLIDKYLWFFVGKRIKSTKLINKR